MSADPSGGPQGDEPAPVEVLPDILAPGLAIVFVGTTVGALSAARGHYHSGRHNCFWKLLFAAGFTPALWTPEDDARLPLLGLGLTDLRKDVVCSDDRLLSPLTDAERRRFEAGVRTFRPRVVCFNGKSPYQMWRARPGTRGSAPVEYGLQVDRIGESDVFVAPSTSGASAGISALRLHYYRMLREAVRQEP